MRKSRLVAIAATGAIISGGALAATVPAMASTPAVHVTTVSPEHPDTTGVTCSACLQGPGGPIWANDHLKEIVTVTSAGAPNHYNVVIRFGGSTFSGFADPRAAGEAGSDGSTTGGPMFSQGKITGSITYDDITSTQAPDASNVPATQAPNASLSDTLSELFHGQNGSAVSTNYSLNYTPSLNSVDPTGASSSNVWPTGTVYNQHS